MYMLSHCKDIGVVLKVVDAKFVRSTNLAWGNYYLHGLDKQRRGRSGSKKPQPPSSNTSPMLPLDQSQELAMS